MAKIHHEALESKQDNPVTDALVGTLLMVLRHPAVVAAVRELVAPAAPSRAQLTTTELANERRVSKATIVRLAKEPGCPVAFVGSAMRFDADAFDAWLMTRGKKPTKAPKPDADPIDISSAARSAGLRVAGGSR